ncbi:NEL-type E3 ubiquitin ligase domain-containing protein [Pseudomonas sp. Irchel s3b5]|uniref:NEL-type E3 ubiquitin ligase domain-containing protein n=1 Tax=Pseudomonas sp. Irchel s3b5 TaxID=2009077 RepID=UPI000BA34286|nr:NEL-type E3 ubiquitin ligase domain-containing protein [Pseudomonas sp. Irchel s3b5]
MLTTPATTPPVNTVTSVQRLEVLLKHTGELAKAEALQASIPQWLANASLTASQALNSDLAQSRLTYAKAAELLGQLKPMDEFCKQALTSKLKEKWKLDIDVEQDTLEIVETVVSSIGLVPVGYETGSTNTSRSLLHAAMENFTEQETKSAGIPSKSFIKINGVRSSDPEITPAKFAKLCRELDCGALYQGHIQKVLAVPDKPKGDSAADVPASTADIRQLKLLDMKVAAHIAHLKQDISPAVYTMLLNVIEQDVPAEKTQDAVFDGGPVIWQGLMIHDACICGALVFTKESIDTAPSAKCVVYMPNEPRRPLYEYESLDAFKTYLALHLKSTGYKRVFVEQYLPGHDKSDFFTVFDKTKTLGTLIAMPADTCLGDFFFSAFLSKTQKYAKTLAVPSADVDAQQREKTIQALLNGGLLMLNAASFFVPVVGQLMLSVAVVEILDEVYEGVRDWAHDERAEALSHLLSVVESVAQMAAFAAGGKVIATALRKTVKEQAAFFDGFEAVTRNDGKARLWKNDLKPYRQISPLDADVEPDSEGVYKQGELSSIKMDGAIFRVSREAAGQPWKINHPMHPDTFKPAIERTVEGGWRHVYEHTHEWPDSAYALERTDPRLNDLGSELSVIADITDMSPAKLHALHESHLKLPQRLNDCVERVRLDRKITALITAMEREETANTNYVQEQLQVLPKLPGWPAERFIELIDEDEVVLSRFPETAPTDDMVNGVQVCQEQLDAGELLDTVIKGLYPKEVEAMIGSETTQSKSVLLAKAIASHLKSDRQPLLDWLYKKHDGPAIGDVATLREQFPDLPVRVGQELLDNASARDRILLRDRKIPGLDLARQAREAGATIRQDRALMGLHLPQLANADTENLSLRLMDQVQGWDEGFRLEVRDGSETGALLDSVGKEDAALKGVIVKTADGYQVTQRDGSAVTTTTNKQRVESIYHALPQAQRSRMGFTEVETVDVSTLRSRLLAAAPRDQVRTRRMLDNERREVAEHLSSCALSDPSGSGSHSRGLIRKVRKLYPLFTDAQASTFLDEAGSTHTLRANRIKALEQQLKTLRQVLHVWRDNEVDMAKLSGQLGDIRVSRRQVADAIENCWRRITPPVRLGYQSPTTLKLERNPAGPLPTLTEQDVAHVRSLYLKDMEAGDELAYFLKPFKGLVHLELDGNKLTRLPEALSHMPNLQRLSLDRNQITLTEHTLRKLADMTELRMLSLSDNRLGATPDIRKLFSLHSLGLSNTHATELPLGLNRLPYLDMVNLRGNQIRELPDWLFEAPAQFAEVVNLRLNPLSEASQTKLQAYRDRTGQGMGYLDNDTAVIDELKARELWMAKSYEENYASRNRAWQALKNEPDSAGFFGLLAEVGGSADSRYVREDLTRRVWSVIEAAQADPALCERLLVMAEKSSCGDSAALIFSNLELAVELDSMVRQSANTHDEVAQLLRLGRSQFNQDYIARIAREHIQSKAKAKIILEPTEVELAFRTGLAERLYLMGQPRHMRYASIAGVTTDDLDAAYNRVVAANLSSERTADLCRREFWVNFLRTHHGEQFSELAEPFHQRLQKAFESEAKLGNKYLPLIDTIKVEQQQAETTLVEKLTKAAIQAEETKTCFVLD